MRRQYTTMDEILSASPLYNLKKEEFDILMYHLNGYFLRNKIQWNPLCGTVERDVHKLLYGISMKKKKKVLSEVGNVINENWVNYVYTIITTLNTRITLLQYPYKYILRLLFTPSFLIETSKQKYTSKPMNIDDILKRLTFARGEF